MKDTDNLTIGTAVMVINQRLPQALWPVGRVTKIIRSANGMVRTAEVQVDERTYTRPVAKFTELPAFPGTNSQCELGGSCAKGSRNMKMYGQ